MSAHYLGHVVFSMREAWNERGLERFLGFFCHCSSRYVCNPEADKLDYAQSISE